MSFDVRNPNIMKIAILYKDVKVYYKSTKLSETDLAPFRQGIKEEEEGADNLNSGRSPRRSGCSKRPQCRVGERVSDLHSAVQGLISWDFLNALVFLGVY